MVKRLFLPEIKMGSKSTTVLNAIKDGWPTNPLEVATKIKESGSSKQLSARILYHFRKLQDAEEIRMKKIGNTFVAWPRDIEKLRIIHELVRE